MLAVLLVAVGLGMVTVGSAAIYALKQSNTQILGVVWCIDVVFFWLLLVISVVGLLLGLDARDPVRRAVNEMWGVHSINALEPVTAEQTNYRLGVWDSGYCVDSQVFGGRKQSCEAVFIYQAKQVMSSTAANFTAGTSIRDIFSDCGHARRGVMCVPASTDAAELTYCSSASAPEACTELQEGRCFWEIHRTPPNRAEACVPAPDCNIAMALATACDDCNHKCKEDAIADLKTNLHPASIVVIMCLVFCVVSALLNDAMVTNDEFDGVRGYIGYVLNGLVSFTGFLLAIVAGLGWLKLAEQCPEGADCSNSAVMIAVGMVSLQFASGKHMQSTYLMRNDNALQGLVLMAVGCAGVYGIRKNANWPSLIGRKLIYIVNIVLLCCALVLSVTAVILSIIGGTLRHRSFRVCIMLLLLVPSTF